MDFFLLSRGASVRVFIVFFFSMMLMASSIITSSAQGTDTFRQVLADNFKLIQKGSTRTISPVLEAIQNSEFGNSAEFLGKWQSKELWFRKSDKAFFYAQTDDQKTYTLTDVVSGDASGDAAKKDIRQVKPNSGVRALIAARLVQFQLADENVDIRKQSLQSIGRDPKSEHLDSVRLAIGKEKDADLLVLFTRVERLLTVQFDKNDAARIEAIKSFKGTLSIDVRAAFNQLLAVKTAVAKTLPSNQNIARTILPGITIANQNGTATRLNGLSWFTGEKAELSKQEAYEVLVNADFALEDISRDMRKEIIIANINDGKVGNVAVADLDDDIARDRAYEDLVLLGKAQPFFTDEQKDKIIDAYVFHATYTEPNSDVTDAARETINSINASVEFNEYIDLTLDGISLASIYFLAAIGLAITFGVMRVINMAHGEFIMMGAYSGYVVQQLIPNYTISIIVAIPVAFMATFSAGVVMERLIIRHLYNRPLETLLATFGISIALQQMAKNIFGTQARPLTAPSWLDGAWIINDVVSISWIRVAIFVLGALFFCTILFVLNRTRLGLETRAVTQNPRMAASMGIDPDKINMLTFGLGCGIAGIAGVAIGLFAKVTSEIGNDYIVQSFMTVVVGGVGNIWGTLAGATLIGFLQKMIENFNPSNTLAAQTYMIIFIIIFIQFRPRGLIALKGRAAEA